jgi:CheY-like chemotaxis protein
MAKKLLLADDSQTIHRVLELTFAEEDFEIISAYNGNEALEKLKEVKPDLVITDVNMPEMDGYQVCQNIKNDPETSHIPVILLKGTFEPFDEAKATACQNDGIIAKPFQTKNIIKTVKDILSTMQPSGEEELLAEEEKEETEEEAPMDLSQPPAFSQAESPEIITEEQETISPEEEQIITEQEDMVQPEAPPEGEMEQIKETVADVPELESLTEEEILGLEEPSEGEILLEDISTEQTEEEHETLDTGLEEEKAALDEAAAEESMEEEPFLQTEDITEEEPAPAAAEPLELTEEEIIAEKKALGFESTQKEEPQTSDQDEITEAPDIEQTPFDEGLVEKIANKVIEKLSSETVEKIAWEVVPDMAERIIKKAISEIKKT